MICFDAGYKRNNNYVKLKKLTSIKEVQNIYEEDEKIEKSFLYNNNGNRKIEHAIIKDIKIVKNILKMRNINNIDVNNFNCMSISLFWSLKRKEYNYERTFNNMSMIIFYNDNTKPLNIIVSNNIYREESQNLANKIIEYINNITEVVL